MGETKHSYLIRMGFEGGKVISAELQKVGADGQRSFQKIEDASVRADNRLNLFTRSILTRFIPALSAAAAARGLQKNLLEFEKLDNRLKFLTDSSEDYARAQEFIGQTARDLHIDIFAVADGYARLLALQKSGVIDNKQLESLLVGFANAKAALGADDTQIGQVFYGLSQALGQATVQAAELNQVVEPLPGLLNALDKAAGLPAGGFRNLVKEGGVSSKYFGEILPRALKEYEGAAKSMDGTVTAAYVSLGNAWKELAIAIDQTYLPKKLSELVGILTKIIELSTDATNALRRLFDPTGAEELLKINTRIAELNSRSSRKGIFGSADRFFEGGELENLKKQREDILKKIAVEQTEDRKQKQQIYGPFLPPKQVAVKPGADEKKQIKEMEKEADRIRKVTEELRFRNEQVQYGAEDQEIFNEIRAAGVSLYSAEGQEIARMVDDYYRMNEAQEANKRSADAMKAAVDDMITGYQDLRSVGLRTLSDLLKGFIDLANGQAAASNVGGFLAKSIFGAVSGGFGARSTAIANPNIAGTSYLLPGRAGGGDVMAGESYWVGEEGPEILRMGRQSGTIIPSHKTGGAGTVIEYLDARGADRQGISDLMAMVRQLDIKVNRVDRSIEPRATAAVESKRKRSNNFLR